MTNALVIARRAYAMIDADCRSHAETETGGLLLGRQYERHTVVPLVIPAGPGARRSSASFSPDARWQQEVLNLVFTRFGTDYEGDWHRHPGSNDRPSAIDYKTAVRIVTSKTWNKPEAVFPIVTIQDGRVTMRAYRMTRAEREFVEIPIEVVPDTDPRIRSVLLGAKPS